MTDIPIGSDVAAAQADPARVGDGAAVDQQAYHLVHAAQLLDSAPALQVAEPGRRLRPGVTEVPAQQPERLPGRSGRPSVEVDTDAAEAAGLGPAGEGHPPAPAAPIPEPGIPGRQPEVGGVPVDGLETLDPGRGRPSPPQLAEPERGAHREIDLAPLDRRGRAQLFPSPRRSATSWSLTWVSM